MTLTVDDFMAAVRALERRPQRPPALLFHPKDHRRGRDLGTLRAELGERAFDALVPDTMLRAVARLFEGDLSR